MIASVSPWKLTMASSQGQQPAANKVQVSEITLLELPLKMPDSFQLLISASSRTLLPRVVFKAVKTLVTTAL